MQTLPAVITIPAAPGPCAVRWECSCGNLLGLISNGYVFSRHKRRQVDAPLPARVQCDRCGRKNVRSE